jgi:hypothetical protein
MAGCMGAAALYWGAGTAPCPMVPCGCKGAGAEAEGYAVNGI